MFCNIIVVAISVVGYIARRRCSRAISNGDCRVAIAVKIIVSVKGMRCTGGDNDCVVLYLAKLTVTARCVIGLKRVDVRIYEVFPISILHSYPHAGGAKLCTSGNSEAEVEWAAALWRGIHGFAGVGKIAVLVKINPNQH